MDDYTFYIPDDETLEGITTVKGEKGTSGTPLVATSTSAMTDKERIYINTTDGHWYYWNGAMWEDGGVYQATGIGNGSVSLGSLTNELADDIYQSETDITKLGNIRYSAANDSRNFTTPMTIKGGTTVTFSEDFVSKYHYQFKRVNATGGAIATTNPDITSELTDTSYTFNTSEHCVLCWRPIDNNWESETYVVDRAHVLDNSDVTSIKYYIPRNNHFKLIDIDASMAMNNMFGCVHYGNPALGYQYSVSRLMNARPFYSDYQILFHVKEGYEYDYATFDGGGVNANRLTHTGWINTGADILIPAKTYFGFCIRKSDNSNFLKDTYDWRNIVDLNSYANYSYVEQYIDDHISTVGLSYNYHGIDLNLQYKHGYEYAASTPLAIEYRSIQGFTIYGNYIFQFYTTGQGLLRIFDKATGTLVAEHNTYTSHGGSCAFSNTYADPDDDFPLLYVSSGNYDYPQIVVLRIQDVNTVSVYKRYQMDADKIGYWSEQCFDFETGIGYSFGYTKNSFTDRIDNPIKVCVIDLNSEALISDNIYSLDIIDNYTIPYVYVIQSAKFKNGLCYIVSSYQSSVQASDIRVYDPAAKTFVANFPDLPLPLRGEIEDLDFVENPTTSKYDMIVGVNGDPNYWKLTFM